MKQRLFKQPFTRRQKRNPRIFYGLFPTLCLIGIWCIRCGGQPTPSVLEGKLLVEVQERNFDSYHAESETAYYLQSDRFPKPIRLDIPTSIQGTFRFVTGVNVRATFSSHLSDNAPDSSQKIIDLVRVIPETNQSSNRISLTKKSTRRLIIAVVNLEDRQASGNVLNRNYVDESIKKINTLYSDSTHGLVQFSLDQAKDIRYLSVKLTSQNCTFNELRRLVKEQIGKTYHRHLMMITPHNTCHLGVAHTGHPESIFQMGLSLWANQDGSLDLGIIAHELGHNLGLRHAGTDHNDNEILESSNGSNQKEWAYGDFSSFMGAGTSHLPSLNAPQMLEFGVFHRYPGSVAEGKNGQTYTIAALSLDPNNIQHPQLIVFRKPNSKRLYMLSYKPKRSPSSKGHHPLYDSGVSLHTHRETTYLVDVIQHEKKYQQDGLTIDQVRVSENKESVKVRLSFKEDQASCKKVPPTFSFENSLPSTIVANELTEIRFQVKNNDPLECPDSTFHILSFLDGNYEVESPSTTRVLAPQERRRMKLWIRNDGNSRSVKFSLADSDSVAPHHGTQSLCFPILVNGDQVETDQSICDRTIVKPKFPDFSWLADLLKLLQELKKLSL